MEEPSRRYRPPRQSSYAKGSWWAGHGAELIGAVAGFVAGFVLLLLASAVAPTADFGWLPWLTMLIGAFGLRYVVRRRLER